MDYLKHTEYDKEPGGIKKLGFIIDCVKNNKKNGARILDVGCGNGNVSFPLAYLGYYVTAIDISSELIEKNSRKNKFPNLSFQVSNLDNKNFFLQEKFDVILALDILEHLEKPKILMSNFRKLSKDDAILIVSLPNGFGFSELASRFIRGMEKITGIKFVNKFKKMTGRFSVQSDNYTPHLQHFKFKEFVSLAEECGFRLVEYKKSTVFSSTLRWRGRLEKLDLRLADILSKNFSSGWYFLFKV